MLKKQSNIYICSNVKIAVICVKTYHGNLKQNQKKRRNKLKAWLGYATYAVFYHNNP